MPFYYTCQTCGAEVTKPTVSHAKAQFCSRTCWHQAMKVRHPPIECQHCHQQFHSAGASTANRLSRKFCSHACQMQHRHGPPEERFWKHVEKTESCWNWIGHIAGGYGRIYFRGKQRQVHHYAWERERGPVPEGLFVLHHCDNPRCVRFDHLFIGTQAENLADMVQKGRHPFWRPK